MSSCHQSELASGDKFDAALGSTVKVAAGVTLPERVALTFHKPV